MNKREIDRLIATKIMGYEVDEKWTEEINDDFMYVGVWISDAPAETEGPFAPSEDISDAWQVVDKVRESRNFDLSDAWDENDKKIFYSHFQYDDSVIVRTYSAYAETAPLAICLAALKAYGVELEEAK